MSRSIEFELEEAQLELERHHKDFKLISDIVHAALDNIIWDSGGLAMYALKAIRNIVG